MAGETPFASSFAGLPSFDDGPGDLPLDALNLACAGSAFSRASGQLSRRSLDEAFMGAAATGHSSSMVRSHTLSNPFDVGEMLNHINSSKLAGRSSSLLVRADSAGSMGGPTTLTDAANRNLKWIQPSGARQAGQGCEEVEQGIVHVEQTATGGAVLRITLLAAGFIIGKLVALCMAAKPDQRPSGSSVRDICRLCGTDIRSWTCEPDGICSRPTRQFQVEGPPAAVARSLGVMCDAVQRYKELCEGKYAGQSVPRVQHVGGVDFSYQPPPRNIVPYAASLKNQGGLKRQGSGPLPHKHGHHQQHPHGHNQHYHHGRPPTGPSCKGSMSGAPSFSTPFTGASLPPQAHQPTQGMTATRSSSLPVPLPLPLPRPSSRSSAPSPTSSQPAAKATDVGTDAALPVTSGTASSPKLVSVVEPKILHSGSSTPEDQPGPENEMPSGCGVEPMPSPFGTAAGQEIQGAREAESGSDSGSLDGQQWASPPSAADGKKSKRRGLETPVLQASLPAPANTLDKEAVLKAVFSGLGQASSQGASGPEFSASDLPGCLPSLLQQLALQQHQQQLAATAAAAQALFPAQSSLLSEIARLAQPGLAALSPASAYAGRTPLQGQDMTDQLHAALAALGLGGAGAGVSGLLGSMESGQAGFMGGPQGFHRSASGGVDWSVQASRRMGSYNSAGTLDAQSLLQLATSGLLHAPLVGPGTPTPAPLAATPFPSPEHAADHRQLLAALQAFAAGSPPFGAVGSPPQPPHSSPVALGGSMQWSPGFAQQGATSSPPMQLPLSSPLDRASRPAHLPADQASYSVFGSPSILGSAACQGQGQPSDFIISAFASPPGSGLKLPRASSLAFADGASQPPEIAATTAGRSASLPLQSAGGHEAVPGAGHWSDPWDDIVAAALESEGGGDNPQAGWPSQISTTNGC
ncbi:hypothetical protein N2152v2_001865 [Parachlorella kessleri]